MRTYPISYIVPIRLAESPTTVSCGQAGNPGSALRLGLLGLPVAFLIPTMRRQLRHQTHYLVEAADVLLAAVLSSRI
jgi:hypothetical protein